MTRQPFVLRMAGAPFAWLAELADGETAGLAREIVAAEREQEERVGRTGSKEVLEAVRASRDRGLLRAARTGRGTIAVDRIESPPVRALFAEIAAGWAALDGLAARLRQRHDEALTEARHRVSRRFATDNALRDMLFALNPGSYPEIARWLDRLPPDPGGWRTKDRVKVDPLTLYLQRVCAKNDSTGRAGPFAVGVFDPDVPGLHAVEAPLRRHVLISRWAADAVLAWLAREADTSQVVAPRRAPGVAVTGGNVDQLLFDYTEQHGDLDRAVGPLVHHDDLSIVDLDVLRACDGQRAPAEISAAVGRDAEPSLARLAACGLVLRQPEIPYGVEDPLPLLDQLARATGSASAQELVLRFAASTETLAHGDVTHRQARLDELADLFTRTVGGAPTRNNGGFYEDRALVYEESTGRFDPLVLGAELTRRVRSALPLITGTYLFLPRRQLRLEGDLLAEWFAGRFPFGSVPVNRYLRAYADDQARLGPAYARLAEEVNRWHARLRDAASGCGSAAQFQEWLVEHGDPMPAVCDIDLMFAGARQADGLAQPTRLVVTEVHSDEELLTHGMFAPFVEKVHPTFTGEVLDGYRGLVGADEVIMNATIRHYNKTFARRLLDCPDIEACDRSPAPPELRRHLADLVVVRGPDGLRLVERASGRGVRLVALPLAWLRLPYNPMSVFGFPKRRTGSLFSIEPGENLPEVSFDDVLLSRRAWSVASAELAGRTGADGFLAVQRLRDRLGLPRHVFARIAGERKPIYVDLDSPLLVRQLSRFAVRATSVSMSEMVPGPDELWARCGGQAYTSELRFAAFDARR